MTEEIAYAELNFQRSFKEQENIPKGHTAKHKDIPVSSFRWRFCASVSLFLCLLLTIGLLVLGIIYLQHSTRFQREYGDLKSMMEDLRTNSSMRILNLKKHLCLKGEGEEGNMQTDPRCMLCPLNWHLNGVTCYYISRGLKSWQESKQFCDSRNSTLLFINEENKELITLQSGVYKYFWIGIHKDKSGHWIWDNGTHITQLPKWLKHNIQNTENKEDCAYLYTPGGVYRQTCDQKYQWICEKAGIELA